MPNRSRSNLRRAAVFAGGLGLLLGVTAAGDAAAQGCDVFAIAAAAAGGGAAGNLDSPGLDPAPEPELDPELEKNAGRYGPIVRIPDGKAPDMPNQVSGEALLVLPKLASGDLSEDFTLGPDAEIVDSFWSPVLCASVVRIRGPEDAKPEDLVTRAEPPAVVLPHRRYQTSAAEAHAATLTDKKGPDPYQKFQLGLARLGVMEARGRSDGKGARVALLDSAPDVKHRELTRVRLLPLAGGPPSTPALHGTLMAGLISAIQDNAFGIVGIAPAAELLAIPVCKPVGNGTSDVCDLYDVLRGMDLAWENEARIVNLSLVGPPDPLMQRAVARMTELGAVVVAAAGNSGSSEPTYPAAYPGVVGVGAADQAGRRSAQSNRGPWVALDAPGVEVLSTVPNDSFAFVNGSSLAAAQVSGVLALLTSVVPDAQRMRLALLATARGKLAPASATSDPAAAEAPIAPTVCAVLAEIGQPCVSSSTGQPSP